MGAIVGKKLEAVICPLCQVFSSKRFTALSKHFFEEHGKTEQEVWDDQHGERPKCSCGCQGEVRWNGWGKGYSSVIKGHNGKIYVVCTPEEASIISKKRSDSLRGKTGWSKGLTKETDERIALRAAATSLGRQAAFDRGDIESWSKGLTKESDSRVADAALNLKKKFKSGEAVPWAKGLTKKTDIRIANMAAEVSIKLQQKSIRERLDSIKRLSIGEIQKRIEESGGLTVVDGLQNYVNDASRVIMVKCNRCEDTFQGSLRVLGKGRCFKCAPGGSAAQEEVARFVESLGIEIKRNDRKETSLELDIYAHQKRVAIEYNGLYWHCHINRSQHYHSNKSQIARDAGISLIHVFEDEWRDKRPIIESIVRAKLGLCTNRIGARSCKLVQITSEQRKEFFKKNHLDGDVRAEISWGLLKDDKIIYALSLRKPFHKKYDGQLEVARCCPALGYSVPGGLSRLVKTAENHCKSLGIKKMITYVDTRLGGAGKGYELSGFKKESDTVARWWWTDMSNRFNRFKYKADSEQGLTEAQVAESAGVVKIWGCENSVFVLNL